MKEGQTVRVPRSLLEQFMPSYVDVEVVKVDKAKHTATVKYALTRQQEVRLADLSQTAGASRAVERVADDSQRLPPSPGDPEGVGGPSE